MSGRRVAHVVVAGVLALWVAGCGSELTAQQQRDYDALKGESAGYRTRIASTEKEADRLFVEVSRVEKSKRALTERVVVCGRGEGGGMVFGPLPFAGTKNARIGFAPGPSHRFGAASCRAFARGSARDESVAPSHSAPARKGASNPPPRGGKLKKGDKVKLRKGEKHKKSNKTKHRKGER